MRLSHKKKIAAKRGSKHSKGYVMVNKITLNFSSLIVEGYRYIDIEVSKIIECPLVNYRGYSTEGIEFLASSMKKDGLQTPIEVREVEGLYEVLAGKRRWVAAVFLGMTTIKAVVSNISDSEFKLQKQLLKMTLKSI